MRPSSSATRQPFRHHILGTVSFDTPFLGMHPGVVISGIGSLFRPAPESPTQKQAAVHTSALPNTLASPGESSSSVNQEYPFPTESAVSLRPSLQSTSSATSSLSTPQPGDPYYNPPFPNDVHIPERKALASVLHFINKHSEGLTSATKQYFMSHLEFGACLADWQGLKTRYATLRSLEDVDDLAEISKHGYDTPKRRVRFINYYTASTGRPKAPKAPKIPEDHMTDKDGNKNVQPIEVEMKDMSLEGGSVSAPTIQVEETSDGGVRPHTVDTDAREDQEHHEDSTEEEEEFFEPMEMQHIDSLPIPDDEPDHTPIPEPSTENREHGENREHEPPAGELTPTNSQSQQPSILEPLTESQLPPVPKLPVEPEPVDLSSYTDKDARKLAEKEHKRVVKAFQQAVKDRESAIKDRKKLVEKREKRIRQEQEKQQKAELKQRQKEEKEKEKQLTGEEKRLAEEAKRMAAEAERLAGTAPSAPKGKEKAASEASTKTPKPEKAPKPKRDRKFCLLPSDISGPKDVCWERVYMEGVDEVGAHCGLFFPGPQYENLVGNVGHRIEEWVREDATRRALIELQFQQD